MKNYRKEFFPFKAKYVAFTKSFLPKLDASMRSVNKS